MEGTITAAESGGFRLKLVMRSGDLTGERYLKSRSCLDLAGAAAVTLALLLRAEEPLREADLVGTAGESGASPVSGDSSSSPAAGKQSDGAAEATNGAAEAAPGAAEPAPGAAEATQTTPPTVTPTDEGQSVAFAQSDSERGWHGLLRGPFAALSLGPLPQRSWGVGFGAGVSIGSWRLSLEASKWMDQDIASAALPGYGATVKRLTGLLKACHAFRSTTFEVAPCLVLAVERIAARGSGQYVASRSEQATGYAAGGGLQGRIYLKPWFSLAASVDAQVEASRPRITINGVGEVSRLAPAAITVTFGPEWFL